MAFEYIKALSFAIAVAAVGFAISFLFNYACIHFKSKTGLKKWLTKPWVIAVVLFIAVFTVSGFNVYFKQRKARPQAQPLPQPLPQPIPKPQPLPGSQYDPVRTLHQERLP